MKNFPPFEGPNGPAPSGEQPFALLQAALRSGGGVQVVRFDATVQRVRFVTRKGKRSALLLVEAPSGVGENLKGPAKERDSYLLIHVPRATADAFDEEASRRIILPGAM